MDAGGAGGLIGAVLMGGGLGLVFLTGSSSSLESSLISCKTFSFFICFFFIAIAFLTMISFKASFASACCCSLSALRRSAFSLLISKAFKNCSFCFMLRSFFSLIGLDFTNLGFSIISSSSSISSIGSSNGSISSF